MKLAFSRQIFENGLNIKFYLNSSIESRVVPCGHDEVNGRFSQFCESAYQLKVNRLSSNRVFGFSRRLFKLKSIPQSLIPNMTAVLYFLVASRFL